MQISYFRRLHYCSAKALDDPIVAMPLWRPVGRLDRPQSFTEIEGKPSDVYEARCASCQEVTTFVFDVSPFFSRRIELQAWAARTLPDVDQRTRDKVLRKVGPDFMTRFMTFVRQRANDRNVPTLLYLRTQIDAVLHALSPGDEGSAS